MKKIGWYFTLVVFTGCKEKYMPKVNTPASGFLVVEGLINAGTGPTQIRLTRASGLDSIHLIYERGAEVEVQSSNGASHLLGEQSEGIYSISQVPVDQGMQYRLHIKTSNGSEYISDYAQVKISPPIDSVSWEPVQTPAQVRIEVTTHDNSKGSVYYQWEYEETWKYGSPYRSEYIVDSLGPDYYVLVTRPVNMDFPRICWRTDTSTRIIVASSAKLQKDFIDRFPVNTISYAASNRLIQRYSILVKQYILSKDGYEWKQKVQKNTEQIGSIFDAQPSETGGNIHSLTNPAEKVIGFIECSSIVEKRIFIDRSQLPPVTVNTGFLDCEEGKTLIEPTKPFPQLWEQKDLFVVTGLTATRDSVFIAPIDCVDCRLRGGVSVQPDFWQ